MDSELKAKWGDDLYNACIEGHLDTVRAAIDRAKATDPQTSLPFSSILYTAASKDRVNIARYALDEGATVNSRIVLICWINRAKDTYSMLLDTNAIDVNYAISKYGAILSMAATADNLEWANICLSHGADPNSDLVDQHMSVLAAVAELASTEMAQLLIDHGASVRDSGAIVMAAEAGKMDMVKLLLANGASVNEIGIEHPMDPRYREDMGSALHKAAVRGFEEIARFLLRHGADIKLKDPCGKTPLELAKEAKQSAMVEMLEELGTEN